MSTATAELERPYDPIEALDFAAGLIDADAIPELRAARQQAAQAATSILARNRQLVADGHTEVAPIEVDVLGTARRVVEARNLYGKGSPEYRELETGLVLDCERVIGEAERKLTWEYFGDAPQKYDAKNEQYLAHGVPLPEILTAGLTPLAKPEEQDRRVNEYVEEMGTYAGLGKMARSLGDLALGNTVSALTISECTDYAIEDHKHNPKAANRGYVAEIEKFMTREVIFTKSGDRVEHQLALSGVYITRRVIMNVLTDLRVIADGHELSKTELHGKQLIDPASRGVIWFAELLDKEASRQSSKRIFMGEEVDEQHPMDYASVPLEAEARRVKLAPKPQELADYILELQERDTDRQVAEGLVNAYLKEMLLTVASNDLEKAAIMFDRSTADGFRLVAHLEALGLGQEADLLRAEVGRNAPDVSYCGAGSCGLEAVSLLSSDAAKAKELGLVDGLLHDKERACINCHKKKVHYDSKANKACTACGSTQINGKVKLVSAKANDK